MDAISTLIRQAPARAGTVDFVTGRTRLYGIVGHPIEQARSPETVTYELRRRGLDAILLPIHIRPEDFDDVFPALLKVANLDGLVVTVPHKPAAMKHVALAGPLGHISSSISVIGRTHDDQWIGEMFDGVGCVSAIQGRGVQIRGARVLLLGAGGAGSAIASEVLRHGPAELHISDPHESRLAGLLGRLEEAYPRANITTGAPALSDIDILINASPVGMLDETSCPLAVTSIPSHVVVMDAIMDPDRTKLLRIAEESGCLTVYGREMLDSQISCACDFLMRARSCLAADFNIHPNDPALQHAR